MPGSIVGRAVDMTGAPVAGASVAIAASDSLQPVSDIAALTTADGRFRFSNVEPGTYTVSVHSSAFPPGQVSATVVDGQQTEVEVLLGAVPAADAVLEVSLVTDRIDWNQVLLVRASLAYDDPDRGIDVANEFLFSTAGSASRVWTVQLADSDRDQYDYKIVYFMANGQQKTVSLVGGNERTLILDPQA